ncbi:MAG TPA: hypothetical protein DGV23_11425 [Stenotrophomonas sp.]|nr:hypothetical protein [Stenotrophomonas sp.]
MRRSARSAPSTRSTVDRSTGPAPLLSGRGPPVRGARPGPRRDPGRPGGGGRHGPDPARRNAAAAGHRRVGAGRPAGAACLGPAELGLDDGRAGRPAGASPVMVVAARPGRCRCAGHGRRGGAGDRAGTRRCPRPVAGRPAGAGARCGPVRAARACQARTPAMSAARAWRRPCIR